MLPRYWPKVTSFRSLPSKYWSLKSGATSPTFSFMGAGSGLPWAWICGQTICGQTIAAVSNHNPNIVETPLRFMDTPPENFSSVPCERGHGQSVTYLCDDTASAASADCVQ